MTNDLGYATLDSLAPSHTKEIAEYFSAHKQGFRTGISVVVCDDAHKRTQLLYAILGAYVSDGSSLYQNGGRGFITIEHNAGENTAFHEAVKEFGHMSGYQADGEAFLNMLTASARQDSDYVLADLVQTAEEYAFAVRLAQSGTRVIIGMTKAARELTAQADPSQQEDFVITLEGDTIQLATKSR